MIRLDETYISKTQKKSFIITKRKLRTRCYISERLESTLKYLQERLQFNQKICRNFYKQ